MVFSPKILGAAVILLVLVSAAGLWRALGSSAHKEGYNPFQALYGPVGFMALAMLAIALRGPDAVFGSSWYELPLGLEAAVCIGGFAIFRLSFEPPYPRSLILAHGVLALVGPAALYVSLAGASVALPGDSAIAMPAKVQGEDLNAKGSNSPFTGARRDSLQIQGLSIECCQARHPQKGTQDRAPSAPG